MEFCEENVPPETRAKIHRLMEARGWTFEEAVNEVLLEAITSGATVFVGRRKAPVLELVGLKRPSTG
ncbi:hypothetical protein HB13667_28635 [Pseudomonas putida]|jgi:hypothetical protein|uniref:Uncharacterized protein n=3 Tax=Pseudomonas TaxID=286 RepID=A0A0P7CYB1_PSEPU|nr:hypothetical protein [Pseudomonas kurunegalensis]AHC85721.1 hypothetical protein X969_11225 [Pseudomonas monteilii SB3078]AHC91081.1 hypothetical protein X970_10880 [Pseudomonas monteilii SB3101]ANC80968.1 hypothetical protein KKK_08060 [Pseudomonas putida B6-2]APE99622.1 hypothetical protein BG030_17095 [Pseudomonas putida]AVH38052.1 hypothetical protein AL532_17745 [Pseudomonas monteilii]ESW39329.1 hypothetical protein O164_12740 [Pseudomonas taiwanensis SJ9]KAF4559225.1 hypothetical pr